MRVKPLGHSRHLVDGLPGFLSDTVTHLQVVSPSVSQSRAVSANSRAVRNELESRTAALEEVGRLYGGEGKAESVPPERLWLVWRRDRPLSSQTGGRVGLAMRNGSSGPEPAGVQ